MKNNKNFEVLDPEQDNEIGKNPLRDGILAVLVIIAGVGITLGGRDTVGTKLPTSEIKLEEVMKKAFSIDILDNEYRLYMEKRSRNENIQSEYDEYIQKNDTLLKRVLIQYCLMRAIHNLDNLTILQELRGGKSQMQVFNDLLSKEIKFIFPLRRFKLQLDTDTLYISAQEKLLRTIFGNYAVDSREAATSFIRLITKEHYNMPLNPYEKKLIAEYVNPTYMQNGKFGLRLALTIKKIEDLNSKVKDLKISLLKEGVEDVFEFHKTLKNKGCDIYLDVLLSGYKTNHLKAVSEKVKKDFPEYFSTWNQDENKSFKR